MKGHYESWDCYSEISKLLIIFTAPNKKITGGSSEVQSDKRKPRKEREEETEETEEIEEVLKRSPKCHWKNQIKNHLKN